LGLFICKIFSEMMHGDITLKSEAGNGSTFQLKVPEDVEKALRNVPPTSRVRTGQLAAVIEDS
jgi:K+-sensing histidine kinase KdpD